LYYTISAICRLQRPSNSHQLKADISLLPLTLICDNIIDPGILGTLIRSAVAACCRTVLITRGTVITLCLCVSSQHTCCSFLLCKWCVYFT